MSSTPYYQDDLTTLYCGDMATILPTLKADAVVTDPPYGTGVKYGPSYNDRRADYWEWMANCVRIMRSTAPVVVFTHRVTALKMLPQEWDWVGVWHKPLSFGARLGNSPVLPHWEPIFLYGIHTLGVKRPVLPDVLSVVPARSRNKIGRATSGKLPDRRDRWDMAVSLGHPTPKPAALIEALIAGVTNQGDVILDPFAGSGTTLVAARKLGRKSIGVEIEEGYCRGIASQLSEPKQEAA